MCVCVCRVQGGGGVKRFVVRATVALGSTVVYEHCFSVSVEDFNHINESSQTIQIHNNNQH